ncbi:hypothetical protein [Sphingobacterium chuzhouense]|uniref:Uncharacterized protein n=1 Tax=Sphingobacterium chuzhouense TaxID=1742264 RepID=A0ABR7XN30_9SPHI|nr:hypothetical protein [Sphingobacterium chuzhouense]MBD1420583.1 hypothetical protein [Sphingobacterium chuzhouense]
MKKLHILFVLLLSAGYTGAQAPRYTGGSSGTVPEGITVEIFTEYNRISEYQRTYFLVSSALSDEVEVKIETAITYTCGRVERGFMALTGGSTLHLKPRESKKTGTWLKETQDKECINVGTDDVHSTIVGITYSGVIVKNYSADARKAKQQQNAETTDVAERGQMSKDDQKGARRKTDDDFWNDNPSSNTRSAGSQSRTETAAGRKAREDQAYIDNLNRQMAENERLRQESAQKIDVWSNNLYNTFYAAQAATEARNRLNENSTLSGNFRSVEELEAEFNQKYYAINQDVQEWNEASNQSIQSGVNLLFNDGSASGQATGEFVGLLGSVINNNRAEKEVRERKASLERQKEEALKELNRRKWNAIVELRTKLFEQFADGGTPLSKHRIQSPEVYCFVYSFPANGMNETSPNLYISNVFPVAQYSDGTWPFKNTLVTDIKKKIDAQSIVWMGYYTQKEMAEQMRSSLINLSQKAQLNPLGIEYKGTPAKATINNDDFWGTGESAAKATATPANNKTNTKPTTTKKKEDDFWNN